MHANNITPHILSCGGEGGRESVLVNIWLAGQQFTLKPTTEIGRLFPTAYKKETRQPHKSGTKKAFYDGFAKRIKWHRYLINGGCWNK